MDEIKVVGARIHNLKNINVNISKGGEIIAKGTPKEVKKSKTSKTDPYLN
jgi:excinuclease UvrABC ATPase subunit